MSLYSETYPNPNTNSFTIYHSMVKIVDEITGESKLVDIFSPQFFMYKIIFIDKNLDEEPIRESDSLTGIKYMLLASYYMLHENNKTHNEKIVHLLKKSIEKNCIHSNLLLAIHCCTNKIYDDETNNSLFDRCIELNIWGAEEMKELVKSCDGGPKNFLIDRLIESNACAPFEYNTGQTVEEFVTKWVDDLYVGKIAQFEEVITHFVKHQTYINAINCCLSIYTKLFG